MFSSHLKVLKTFNEAIKVKLVIEEHHSWFIKIDFYDENNLKNHLILDFFSFFQ